MKTELDLYKNHKAAYEGDAGIDLFFPESIDIEPGETRLIDMKIKCEMVEIDYDGFIDREHECTNMSYYLYPRSSIYKTPLRMANSVGIIDSKYRDSIKVAVDNRGSTVYRVEKGERLFQICSPKLEEIKLVLVDSLSSSSRGSGFGSSNKTALN